jgi:hypothetical protein
MTGKKEQQASTGKATLHAGRKILCADHAPVKQIVVDGRNAGRNPAYQAHPGPADTHYPRQGNLFLRAEGVIVDSSLKSLCAGIYFSKADIVGAGYEQSLSFERCVGSIRLRRRNANEQCRNGEDVGAFLWCHAGVLEGYYLNTQPGEVCDQGDRANA